MPKLRAKYSAEQRKGMPFPLNAIEAAYEKDPVVFNDVANVHSDSEYKQIQKMSAKGDICTRAKVDSNVPEIPAISDAKKNFLSPKKAKPPK